MGEYAEMAFDNEFNDYLDYRLGIGNYDPDNDDNLIEDFDADQDDVAVLSEKLNKTNCHEFIRIIKSTEKSNLFEMVGGATHWVSKKHSQIKGNYLFIPNWYEQMLLFSNTKNK